MSPSKNKHLNNLVHYRKRMGLTQEQVAQLLGYKSRNALSNMEMGRTLPRLYAALQLAIVYRVPVDFLYQEKYTSLRAEIRDREAKSRMQRQGSLPLSA